MFPDHFQALNKAGLVPKSWGNKKITADPPRKAKTTSKHDSRKSYLVMPYNSNWWFVSPAKILQRNLKKFQIKLRASITYSALPNIEQKLKSDCQNKLSANLLDLNFETWDCNCRSKKCQLIENANFGTRCR